MLTKDQERKMEAVRAHPTRDFGALMLKDGGVGVSPSVHAKAPAPSPRSNDSPSKRKGELMFCTFFFYLVFFVCHFVFFAAIYKVVIGSRLFGRSPPPSKVARTIGVSQVTSPMVLP